MLAPIKPRPLSRTAAILLALFVTVLWSTSWVLIKLGLRGQMPALTFAGLRYFLAFLCLLPFVRFDAEARRIVRRLPRRDWLRLGLLGLVYYTCTQGALFLALASLPAAMVSLLLNLSSGFVALFGMVFLRERPTSMQWLGLGLAAIGAGVYFLPFDLSSTQRAGLWAGIFCLAANVAAALLSRNANRSGRLPPLLVTCLSMGIGAAALLGTGLVVQGPGRLTWRDAAILLWLAVVNTALAFTLWNWTLQVLTAVESSILNSLLMPQIAVLAFVFLGETISPKGLLGLAIVFAGVLLVQIKIRKKDVE